MVLILEYIIAVIVIIISITCSIVFWLPFGNFPYLIFLKPQFFHLIFLFIS